MAREERIWDMGMCCLGTLSTGGSKRRLGVSCDSKPSGSGSEQQVCIEIEV